MKLLIKYNLKKYYHANWKSSIVFSKSVGTDKKTSFDVMPANAAFPGRLNSFSLSKILNIKFLPNNKSNIGETYGLSIVQKIF